MRTIYKQCLTLLFLVSFFGLQAQNNTPKINATQGKLLGTTSPLSELAKKQSESPSAEKGKDQKKKLKEMPNFVGKNPFPRDFGPNIQPKKGDPLANNNTYNKMGAGDIQELFVLDGIDFDEAQIWPPDVNGDIGENYYVQGVNGTPSSLIRIWDKVTGEVEATISTNTLWDEVGAYVVGDIIVIYDRLENRWLLSEISFSSMTIAISQTSDPMGSYNIYEFPLGSLPDYPKFAVWGDAYYATTNEFNGFNPVYAFDKEDLLTGAANVDLVIYEDIPKLDPGGYSFEVSAAVDFSGVNDPGNTPMMVVRITDDEFANVSTDGIEYFTFETDFDDPSLSVVNGPFSIELAPYESNLCAYGIFDCLNQPDGYEVIGNDTIFSPSPQLSALQQVVMHRPQYRKFNDYESIILNFSVDVTGDDKAGIRWVELRKQPAETEWALYQEGTHSFDDDQNRWMGSVAQDGQGNTLLVYTLGGPNTYNSIAYTGRRNSDPLGEMTFGEIVMTEGQNSTPNARWGDYFAIKTDPFNEDDFWGTAEFVPADQDWDTKVFKLLMRQDTIDGAMSALIMPQTINNLTANEAVEIQIANPGIDSINNISWTVLFEGAEIETGVYDEFLTSGETVNIPLTATVDMSALGTYEFEAYISVEDDQYLLNDTLKTTRTHIASFDIATAGVDGLESGCSELQDFQASYSNIGAEDVTSFTATIAVGGSPEQSVMVTDLLEAGNSVVVDFLDIPVVSGTNTITFGAENVNEVFADQILSNNESTIEYEVIEDPVLMNLEFVTDFFSAEVSWNLVDDDSGDVVYEMGNYPPGGDVFESFDMCVSEGCYTFNLFDSFGDGWGGDIDAYLTITQTDGPVLAMLDDKSFGDIWTAGFCVPKDCADLDVEVEYEDATGNGVDDAAIFINFAGAIESTMYSIDGGSTFQSNPLFTNLVPGSYEVVVDDGLGCTFETTINILVDIELYEDVEFTVTPNPNSGLFKVKLVGYDGPQEIVCKIINSEGKLVGNYLINKFTNGYERTLFTPDLPAGQYYISIQNEAFNQMKSVIKL